MKKIFVGVVALLILFSFGFAIEQYGVISGKVMLKDGSAVPGISVTVTGKALMGEKKAVSDEQGSFRFIKLRVGIYQMVFELEGFKRVIRKNVKVELGKTSTIDVTMELGSIREEILVESTVPVVDYKSSTSQVNITKEIVETLANDRQYQTIMAMMPGAIDANNPFMMGASGSDNMYQFDGMDSTDPETRTWSTAMNFDNFEEMQIVTTGASAEYGRGTGAVINVVTKSGSNKFHGTARISMTKTKWNAKSIGDRYYFDDATHYLNETRPSLNVGGPILKDKLWFFASWERRNKWKPGAVYSNWDDYATDHTPTATKQPYKGHYASGKLTLNLGNHSLMAMWMEDPIDIPNLYGYIGYSGYTPDAGDCLRFQGGWNLNSEWTTTLGSNTYLVARFAMKRNELNNEPYVVDTTLRRGNIYWGGSYASYYTERFMEQYLLNLSHYLKSGFGYHDIKVGAEFLNAHNSKMSNNFPGNTYIRYTESGLTYYKYELSENVDRAYKYNQMITFFLTDKWEVTKDLTLNLGLRVEQGTWKNHAKDQIFKWGFGDMIAPRLGAAYAIGKNKISANWGRYYDYYGWWVVDSMQPDLFTRYYEYWVGEGYGYSDWHLVGKYVFSGGGSSTTMDELKPQYMDEWGIGFERALGTKFSVSVNYLNRSWNQKVEDYDPDLDGVWHFANETNFTDGTTNWGKTYKKYSAFMLTIKKNLGNDKFQFMASYTYSTLKGFEAGDGEGYWGDDPYYSTRRFGYLGNDIRHMVKFHGSIILPFDVVLGTGFYWFSGSPYADYMGAYHAINDEHYDYLVEPRGTNRYAPTWRLDLRLEKRFKIKDVASISAYIDIFNILNTQVEVSRSNKLGDGELNGPIGTTNYTITEPNSNYGNFTEWYPPMSFFVGAKIEF